MPRFTSTPVTAVKEDASYRYDISTADTQGGQRQVTAPVLPSWLTLSNVNLGNGTARITGTPTQAQVGAHAVSLQVRNLTTNSTAVQNFSIVVANVNDAPVITGQTPNPIPLQQGTALTITFSHLLVTDVDDTYPTGFTLTVLNGSNYSRSGNTITPNATFVGTLTVPVRVNDGDTNSNTFNLAVSVASSNRPPVIVAPIPNQLGTEDTAFQLRDAAGAPVTLAAFFRDPDAGDTLRYEVTGLPPSGNLSANATTGQITGTPRAADVRATPYTISVRANDSKSPASSLPTQSFALTITARNRADLSLAAAATPTPALVGAAVEWRLTVTNSGPQSVSGAELTAEFAGNPFAFTGLSTCTVTPSADRQRLTCTLAGIAAGASTTVTLRGTASQDGDVFVMASVRAAAGAPSDPNPANDSVDAVLHIAKILSGGEAQQLPSPNAAGAAAGDVNGDGFADVVLATAASDTAVDLYLNVADGPARRKLAALPLLIGNPAPTSNVALVDIDQDSDLDLVTTSNAGGANIVYRNNGAAVFIELATLEGGASRDVGVADFDGDGLPDLAFANDGANTVFLNRGASGFTRTARLGDDDSRDVVALDFDLDGLPDLVFANANGPSRFYRNLGAGSFAAGVVIDTLGAHAVAGGDLNGDRRPDLVFGLPDDPAGPPANPVYQNNPGTGGGPLFVLIRRIGAAPTTQVLTADLDGDGTVDVIALNTTGTHQVYRGDGAGGLSLHPVQFRWEGTAGAALAKISVDAAVDLAVAGAAGSAVFFNDGRGGLGLGDTTAPVISLLGDATVTVTVGETYSDAGATASDDVDGNITPRIAVTNPVNSAIVGSYTVTYQVRDSSGNGAQATRSVQVAAREGMGGGGGGTMSPLFVLALALLLLWRSALLPNGIPVSPPRQPPRRCR